MTHDFAKIRRDFDAVELLAIQLCHIAGGNWDRKGTRKNLWRRRVMRLLELAESDQCGPRTKRP